MPSFNPEKLFVDVIPPATSFKPIDGRKYTLTHSDLTGELFLDVGYIFNEKIINPKMRDEVLAEWRISKQNQLNLIGKAYVDGGEFSKEIAEVRFNIFKKEMNTALKGIIYGDLSFFVNYPTLLDAPIFIYFESNYPEYRQILYYGNPRIYLNKIQSIKHDHRLNFQF
ncbi:MULTISPECIES: staygreen family protein [Bacillaceae]|uniref:staygreen family protein n=1 Tax=Bacillaceae TaxID=186817 RepID=UPI000BFD0B11|nr:MULTISPECIES: staygreen family protein [Bacillaceae]PGT80597.1 hypothetical protein COD11_20765 [Bacillus sp. AFS040349]UGB28866.1 staygreen family protein [Metabacillus sp. B2-18]